MIEATHCATVFIAPDGFLHNLPFAALPTRRGRWIQTARIALVESVATVLSPTGEGGSLSGATVMTADRVGDDDRPYKPIPAARDEGAVVAELLRTVPHHLGDGAGSAATHSIPVCPVSDYLWWVQCVGEGQLRNPGERRPSIAQRVRPGRTQPSSSAPSDTLELQRRCG